MAKLKTSTGTIRKSKDKTVRPELLSKLKLAGTKISKLDTVDEEEIALYGVEDKKKELELILNEIEERKKNYSIVEADMNRIPQQTQLLNDVMNRDKEVEKPRFFLYYGGNGAGKSFSGAYITVCLALGLTTKKYGLPFLGWKKRIWILTKSGSNVRNTLEPYLLGEGSPTRIPPECIRKVNKDNGVLKGISLHNGTEINVLTYDQGSENLQGANPDWIWLDEEPVNEDVVTEIIARTRKEECEMLVTMTPLSGLTRIYEFFFNMKSSNVRAKSRVYLVSSLDNPFIDKTWTEGLTEDEYRLRVLGSFESPTGLVYSSFHRTRCTTPHFDPSEMGDGVKYYRGIDFGVSHPTGCVFLAVDLDDNIYVFDEVYRQNALIEDIAEEITKKTGLRTIEYTVRDSASKREGIEIAKYGIKTVPADKYSKGEGDVSNRKAGIMMMNQLYKDGKLVISQNCPNTIRELETHYYRENGKKDGEVNKVNDDLLDALRYVIWTIRKNQPKGKTYEQKRMEKVLMKDKTKSTGGLKKINTFVKF